MAVINEPQLKTPAQRVAEGTIIGVGMTIFGLFAILLTLSIWYFAGRHFYSHLFVPQFYAPTVSMLINLFIFGLAAFLVMFLWAQYNMRIFGTKERRQAMGPVKNSDIAPLYNIDESQVALAQGFKTADMEVTADKIILCNHEGLCFATQDPAVNK